MDKKIFCIKCGKEITNLTGCHEVIEYKNVCKDVDLVYFVSDSPKPGGESLGYFCQECGDYMFKHDGERDDFLKSKFGKPRWMTDIKAVITIPADDLGRGKCSIGVTWPNDIKATHKVRITRTSWDDPVDSKYRIPLSSLGGLLDKMYELTKNTELIVWFAVENDENLICIEIYDDYRE